MNKLLAFFLPSVPTLVSGISKAAVALDRAAEREQSRTEQALQDAHASMQRAATHRRAAGTARKTATAIRDLVA